MTFQEQFDFEYLVDRNATYITGFGTNHGWLIGEELDNAVGSIVDKDTAHIPLFYTGTTNPNMVRKLFVLCVCIWIPTFFSCRTRPIFILR